MPNEMPAEPERDELPLDLYRVEQRQRLLDMVKDRGDAMISELSHFVGLCQSDANADAGRKSLQRLGTSLMKAETLLNWVKLVWRAESPVQIDGFNRSFPSALELAVCLSWRAWYTAAWMLVGDKDELTRRALSCLADETAFGNRWSVVRRAILFGVPAQLDDTHLTAMLDIEHRTLRSSQLPYFQEDSFVNRSVVALNVKRSLPARFLEMSDAELIKHFDACSAPKPSDDAKPDHRPAVATPNETVRAALEIIRAENAENGKGLSGKEIVKRLRTKGITIVESTFRRSIVPELKKHGIKNAKARGAYYDPSQVDAG